MSSIEYAQRFGVEAPLQEDDGGGGWETARNPKKEKQEQRRKEKEAEKKELEELSKNSRPGAAQARTKKKKNEPSKPVPEYGSYKEVEDSYADSRNHGDSAVKKKKNRGGNAEFRPRSAQEMAEKIISICKGQQYENIEIAAIGSKIEELTNKSWNSSYKQEYGYKLPEFITKYCAEELILGEDNRVYGREQYEAEVEYKAKKRQKRERQKNAGRKPQENGMSADQTGYTNHGSTRQKRRGGCCAFFFRWTTRLVFLAALVLVVFMTGAAKRKADRGQQLDVFQLVEEGVQDSVDAYNNYALPLVKSARKTVEPFRKQVAYTVGPTLKKWYAPVKPHVEKAYKVISLKSREVFTKIRPTVASAITSSKQYVDKTLAPMAFRAINDTVKFFKTQVMPTCQKGALTAYKVTQDVAAQAIPLAKQGFAEIQKALARAWAVAVPTIQKAADGAVRFVQDAWSAFLPAAQKAFENVQEYFNTTIMPALQAAFARAQELVMQGVHVLRQKYAELIGK